LNYQDKVEKVKIGVHRIVGFLIALVLLALGLQSLEARTIYIGVSNPDMSFLSGGVAKFQGYFKDEGLEVEVLQMNANVSVAALAAGNIDYNLILQSVVTANLRGLPLKVAGILIERPNHALVVHPSIQKFADLKGKKIAISSFGSLVDILARLTSAHFKLDPKSDVQFVAAGSSSARVAQLQAGVVQAAFVTPPGNLRAEAAGLKTLLSVGELFAFPVNGIGLHEQKLRNDREEVKKITRALLKANRFILDNPKGSIKILAAWSRSKPEVAEEAYQFNAKNYSRNLLVSRATLENVIESTRWNVETKKNIAVEEVFDFSIAREILKEIGESPR
jgi:NitT/TauT family transport system substrate-binding protein